MMSDALFKEYAAKNNLVYLDYYAPMVNSEGGLKSELSPDGVHPKRRRLCHHGPISRSRHRRRP